MEDLGDLWDLAELENIVRKVEENNKRQEGGTGKSKGGEWDPEVAKKYLDAGIVEEATQELLRARSAQDRRVQEAAARAA